MERFRLFLEKWGKTLFISSVVAFLFANTVVFAFACGKMVDDFNELGREVIAEVTSDYLITHWGN